MLFRSLPARAHDALQAFLESAFVDSDAAKRVEAAKQHRLETKKLKKATERAARAKQEQGNSSDEDGDDDDEDFDHHVGSGDSGGASRKDHKRLRRSSAVSSSSAGGSTIGHDGNALGEEGNPSTVWFTLTLSYWLQLALYLSFFYPPQNLPYELFMYSCDPAGKRSHFNGAFR